MFTVDGTIKVAKLEDVSESIKEGLKEVAVSAEVCGMNTNQYCIELAMEAFDDENSEEYQALSEVEAQGYNFIELKI